MQNSFSVKEKTQKALTSEIDVVKRLSNDHLLVAGDGATRAMVFDPHTLRCISRFRPQPPRVWCAEEVDKQILLGCNNHFIHIYSIYNNYQQIKVIDSKKDVYAMLVLSDGEMFVDAGFSPSKVQLWQTKSFAMTQFSTTEDSWVALLHEWRGYVVVSLFNGSVIFYEISRATGFKKMR